MKNSLFLLAACTLLLIALSCSKNSSYSSNTGSQITVAKLSGTYALKGLTGTYAGVTISIYDSLKACQKDNLLQLNTDMSLSLIDAGIVCVPPETTTGTWALKADSLLFSGAVLIGSSKIKSFDGTTLVLTGNPPPATGLPAVIVTETTLQKQ